MTNKASLQRDILEGSEPLFIFMDREFYYGQPVCLSVATGEIPSPMRFYLGWLGTQITGGEFLDVYTVAKSSIEGIEDRLISLPQHQPIYKGDIIGIFLIDIIHDPTNEVTEDTEDSDIDDVFGSSREGESYTI